jgi:hypothetical protein
MKPKLVEPKPRKKVEPKSINEIREILELVKQEKLERILFHYEISEMVKEWQQE